MHTLMFSSIGVFNIMFIKNIIKKAIGADNKIFLTSVLMLILFIKQNSFLVNEIVLY